jgi:hypothetical protein
MNNLIAGFGQGISINRSNDTCPEHEYLHCASRYILIFRLAQGSSGVPKLCPGYQNISKNIDLYHNLKGLENERYSWEFNDFPGVAFF